MQGNTNALYSVYCIQCVYVIRVLATKFQFYKVKIIIIIIIKNVLIRVTLHTKVLQGHFTQLVQKHCRSCGTKATD